MGTPTPIDPKGETMTRKWDRPDRDSLTTEGARSLALQEAGTAILTEAGFDVFGFDPKEADPKPDPLPPLGLDPLTILALAPEVGVGRGAHYLWSLTTTEADSIEALMTPDPLPKPSVGRVVDGLRGIDAVARAAADPMTLGPEGDPLGDYLLSHPDGTTTYVDATPRRRRGQPRKPDHLLSSAARRKRAQRERERGGVVETEAERRQRERQAAAIGDSLATLYPDYV